MNSKTITQLVIVKGETAEEFQEKFNSTMASLADQNPQFKFNPDLEFCAFVTYEETEYKAETVADEYHALGLKFLCKNCPLHEEEKDKRKKNVKCKYAHLGFTKLDSCACETFYRKLNLCELEPIGEPIEFKAKEKSSYQEKIEEFKKKRGVVND